MTGDIIHFPFRPNIPLQLNSGDEFQVSCAPIHLVEKMVQPYSTEKKRRFDEHPTNTRYMNIGPQKDCHFNLHISKNGFVTADCKITFKNQSGVNMI